jgi:hypothetical protein
MNLNRLLPALLLALFAAPLFAAAPTPGPTEMIFTAHSPLSDPKELGARLHLAAAAHATLYDIKQEHFLVYIPQGASDDKPMGLIVLALYKHADEFPQQIFPELDAANVALVIPKEFLDTWYQRGAACVDAAFNMQKQFKIDPRRVYIFGGGDWADKDGKSTAVGLRCGLYYPDVFTGIFTTQIETYRPVKAANGGLYSVHITRAPGKQFGLSKRNPVVDGLDNEQEQRFLASYKTDGFKATTIIPVSLDQFHYPNLLPGWLPDVLKFMDDTTSKFEPPTTAPATQP